MKTAPEPHFQTSYPRAMKRVNVPDLASLVPVRPLSRWSLSLCSNPKQSPGGPSAADAPNGSACLGRRNGPTGRLWQLHAPAGRTRTCQNVPARAGMPPENGRPFVKRPRSPQPDIPPELKHKCHKLRAACSTGAGASAVLYCSDTARSKPTRIVTTARPGQTHLTEIIAA